MANAMVIGIGGVGSVIAQKLHEFECFDRIVLADIDPIFAQQLAARTPPEPLRRAGECSGY